MRIGYPRNASWGRAIVTALVLLAFILQSLVVQTHVHFSPIGHNAAFVAHDRALISAAPSRVFRGDLPKNTDDGDATHCPLCQAIFSSGSYLIPTLLQVQLFVAFSILGPIAHRTIFVSSASYHSWQSRAPPAAV